jgi:methylmalonyl-CoA/ethylmalonyl-CoA epimerase
MVLQPFEGLSSIGQINIPVHNLEGAIEFYRDTLGLKYLFQVPNMAFFDCGGIRLLLGIPEDDASGCPSSIIYFKVNDIHISTEALRERGVEIEVEPELIAKMPDHDLWMSFFKDSQGNTHALMSEVPN